MRDIKFEIMFWVNNRDFTTSIAKHYTTLERLTNSQDTFAYGFSDIIAKRQFTDLQDKNGVDIYDGDIVDDQFDCGQLYVISYDDNKACFIRTEIRREPIYSNSRKCVFNLSTCPESLTKGLVIGNIHENPELLEE